MSLDLIIPVYVDTNALLDLLASIEGGFSVVEKMSSRATTSKGVDVSGQAEAGTEFGIANVLSLLKVSLRGSLGAKAARESVQETEATRYHTYGSLLYRLRNYLDEEDIVKRFDNSKVVWDNVRPSDFVEVRGVFRPNPLADALERMAKIGHLFGSLTGSQSTATGGGARQQKSKNVSSAPNDSWQQGLKLIEDVLKDVQKEKVRTFVVDLVSPPSHRAVALMYCDYLRDQTMTEIAHKEYRMLGKVVRRIDAGAAESIELLGGTALGSLAKTQLDQFTTIFGQIEGVNLPPVQAQINGPALEVVPVAVFV